MKTNWQTTVSNLIAALGILALTYGVMDKEQVAAWSGVLFAVVGMVWNGIAARDKNVTSENTDARARAKGGALIFLAVLPVLALAPGCGTAGSASQYRAAATTYRGSVEIATDALRAGLIDHDQAAQFEAARANARALLDVWGALEVQGRGDEFGQLERLESLLDAMIELQENSDGRDGDTGVGSGWAPGREDWASAGGGGEGVWRDHGGGVRPDQGRTGWGGLGLARCV